MADKNITELVSATTVTDDDLLVLQQNNDTKKISGKTLSDYLGKAIIDNSLTLPDKAADAKKTGDNLANLDISVTTNFVEIDADWARGTIVNGVYSASNYKQVATRTAIYLERGHTIKVDSGYKASIFLVYSNSYSLPFYWSNGEYKVVISGMYTMVITSDPEPSSNIQNINEYTVHIRCTNEAYKNVYELKDYFDTFIYPNIESGNNLFNRETITSNTLVDRNCGILAPNTSNSSSDYIRVYANEMLYTKNVSTWYWAVYNLDYTYYGTLPNQSSVTIPIDGYLRVTVANTSINTAIISRQSVLPNADAYKASFIDRKARSDIEQLREEIGMARDWSNTQEEIGYPGLEIRDTSTHPVGSVDLSQYAFASLRVANNLGVPVTLNFYDDRTTTSTMWMKRSDGSFIGVGIPAGQCIITPDDFPEMVYMKYLRPIVTASSAPESGNIRMFIIGRK